MTMVGQVPGRPHWGYAESSSVSDVVSDEMDNVSEPSSYRMSPTPGPVLKEVVDMFHDGDKVLGSKHH